MVNKSLPDNWAFEDNRDDVAFPCWRLIHDDACVACVIEKDLELGGIEALEFFVAKLKEAKNNQ